MANGRFEPNSVYCFNSADLSFAEMRAQFEVEYV